MCTKRWSLVLFIPLITVAIVAQNRYLQQALPKEWGIPEDSLFSSQTIAVADEWWRAFGDAKLDSLVDVAAGQNFSVLTALDRMEQARSQMRIERAAMLPALALNGGWNRAQTSGRITAEAQAVTSYYSATLDASWEIDLFGRLYQRVKAGRKQFQAAGDEVSSVRLSLCAQVVSAYIGLREAQQELTVVERNSRTQAAVLKITEVRYETGLVSKLDVAQARSVYYSTRASIPQLETEINQYITTLAILLGTYPQEVRETLSASPTPLPDYMEPVPIGLPADLLLRRPDVRQAEAQVEANAALLGASKRDWLPQVFLKGSVGYASHSLNELTDRHALTFQVAPSLTWTLFSGGNRLASTSLARANLDESIHQFNQTVLTAVQETDQAMTAYRSSIKQIVAMREVCLQGEETLRLSLELYKQGLSPFQNVLDALRSLLTYQNQLTQAQGYSLLQLISLYKALGGGIASR